jgi:hypothetical protein
MKPLSAPQSWEKDVPCEETNGSVQPMRALYDSIWANGMLETVTQDAPASASPARPVAGMLSVKCVQPGQ